MIGSLAPIRCLIDEYIDLTLRLCAPPSPTGFMLEAVANDMIGKPDDTGLWRRSGGADKQHQRRAHLVFLMAALTFEQRKAVILMRLPIGEEDYTRITQMLTREDEELVGRAKVPKWESALQEKYAVNPAVYDDCVVVRGKKLKFPTREQVATDMGLFRLDGSPDVGRLKRLLAAGYASLRARYVDETNEDVMAACR